MKLPEINQNPNGLHRKYHVEHANGMPVNENAIFFVLRLDDIEDEVHSRACRAAARHYAHTVKSQDNSEHLSQLASDLRALLDEIEGRNSATRTCSDS